ncbi:MAG: hypothetical protein C5B51_04655, partial [Terriglobia bacterium]
MAAAKDPVRIAISVGVYVMLYVAAQFVLFFVLGIAGQVASVILTVMLSAVFANWLALRIYENRPLTAVGLWWNHASRNNLAFGLLGGIGSACLVLAPPLLAGAAHLVRAPQAPAGGTLAFVTVMLAGGAVGEELLFRGYGFQVLLGSFGPYATIIPVGIIFALLHGGNPNATWFGLANTAGFGILFGYAFLRTRDLWLPIGIHFGWNLTLPLFGVQLSGLRMEITGHEMVWTAGKLW